MSVNARYISRLVELQEQLVEAEAQYQSALGKVTAIQQSEGVGQFMYVPAGGSPIQLAVPPEVYKIMLDDVTKASVNSAVQHIARLWDAVEVLSKEVLCYIADAEAKAGVTPTSTPQKLSTVGLTDTGLTAVGDNMAVGTGVGAVAIPEVTTPVPPRVRRIPAGG